MKQILVATDFSKCSMHALEYAIFLANQIGSNIQLVWVDSRSKDEEVFPEKMEEGRKDITMTFDEIIDKYTPDLKEGEISYKIRKGKVQLEIANQAKYSDAEFIIVGTHGVSGFEEFWIGSNAYRIVSHAPCPVISVRADYPIKKTIDKIVVPIDSTLETRQKLPAALKIAAYFDSKLHVVSCYSTTIKAVRQRVDNYTLQVEKYLEEEKADFVIETIKADNVTKSTIEYAKKIDADIITIMTEQETAATNLLLGAYAQQMVNHSPIPVLSLRAKEYIRIQSR